MKFKLPRDFFSKVALSLFLGILVTGGFVAVIGLINIIIATTGAKTVFVCAWAFFSSALFWAFESEDRQ